MKVKSELWGDDSVFRDFVMRVSFAQREDLQKFVSQLV